MPTVRLARMVAMLLFAASGIAQAQQDPCEELRAQVEAKIAANGVTQFAVLVADANAPVNGQVVGTCAMGAKKIVYARTGDTSTAATPPRREAPILTECRDGSTSVGGSCPK